MSTITYPVTILRVSQEILSIELEQRFKGDPAEWVEWIVNGVKKSGENKVYLGNGESYLVEGFLLKEADRHFWQVDKRIHRCSIKFTIETLKLEKCKRI